MTTPTTTPVAAPAPAAAPAAAAQPVGITPADPYGAMSSVFDGLMSNDPASPMDPAPAEPAAVAPAAAAAVEGAAATPTEGTPPAETPPAAATTDGASADPAAPAVPAEPAETDWKAKFDELNAKKAPAVETPPPAETPPPDNTPAPEMYTPEEKEFLTKYQAEWGDIKRGEALMRRAEYGQLVGHVFAELQRVWGPLVERGAQAAEVASEITTLAAIREVHSDYNDEMYDNVVAWADGLTGYRKRLAQSIINDGEPLDVIGLIGEYKSASGLSKPKVVAGTAAVAPAAPAAVVPAVKTELTAAAKQAASALGVVDSKRSAAAPSAVDINDFDGAWGEALTQAK